MTLTRRVLTFLRIDLAVENDQLRARNAELTSAIDAASRLAGDLRTSLDLAQVADSQWRAKVRLLEQELRAADAELKTRRELIEYYTVASDAQREQILEMSGALEQANSQIAILQQQLREEDTDEQLALMNAPAAPTTEAGEDALIQNVTQEVVYRLVGPWLEGEKHFWTFALGTQRVTARIHDKAFLEQMANREVFFAAGDAVRMSLRTATYRKPDGSIYARYAVDRVIGVVPPEKQLDMPALAPATPAAGVTP
jgi:hypothetical protein